MTIMWSNKTLGNQNQIYWLKVGYNLILVGSVEIVEYIKHAENFDILYNLNKVQRQAVKCRKVEEGFDYFALVLVLYHIDS